MRPAPTFHVRRSDGSRAAEYMRLLDLCQVIPGAGVVFHAGWFPTTPAREPLGGGRAT